MKRARGRKIKLTPRPALQRSACAVICTTLEESGKFSAGSSVDNGPRGAGALEDTVSGGACEGGMRRTRIIYFAGLPLAFLLEAGMPAEGG